jgi:hypothetical protein
MKKKNVAMQRCWTMCRIEWQTVEKTVNQKGRTGGVGTTPESRCARHRRGHAQAEKTKTEKA